VDATPVDAYAAAIMSGVYGPVSDWATDFDHVEPEYNRRAEEIWSDLRERCPIAHTERYGGTWLPVTHADVSAIAYDTEHFTSRAVVVSTRRPNAPAPVGTAPPITSDPPFHREARRILLPAFAPRNIEPLEAEIRRLCIERLDTMDGEATIDAARDYAQHIPVNVIARMLGFPVEDADLFREFVHDTLESVNEPAERRVDTMRRLDDYVILQIEHHARRDDLDDLTSFLMNVEMDGAKLSPKHVLGTIDLLLIAGIDTTWSAIGASLLHLARTPADLARLVAEPALVATASEEFLRAFAPVTMARLVAKDVEINGCSMKANDWVLLPFPAANRDPAMFERADEVIIDRAENRHAAFGLGIHRCLGSNLARLELRIAIEEFVRRFPRFELVDEAAVTWSLGQVRGPRAIPIRVLQRA
jgi:cytochrome P450